MAGKDDYLIDTLIDMGAVDPAQVDAARPAAEAAGAGLVDTLVVQKTLNPDYVVQARVTQARVAVVDLSEMRPKDEWLKVLPRHIARR